MGFFVEALCTYYYWHNLAHEDKVIVCNYYVKV